MRLDAQGKSCLVFKWTVEMRVLPRNNLKHRNVLSKSVHVLKMSDQIETLKAVDDLPLLSLPKAKDRQPRQGWAESRVEATQQLSDTKINILSPMASSNGGDVRSSVYLFRPMGSRFRYRQHTASRSLCCHHLRRVGPSLLAWN